MKRNYIRPAIKLIECRVMILQTGSNAQSSMDEDPIDDKTEPDPSDPTNARQFNGYSWFDD